MQIVSAAPFGPLLRAGGAASAARSPATTPPPPGLGAASGTVFLQSPAQAGSVTYAEPRSTVSVGALRSLWADPARSGDAISTRMAANHSTRIYNLADQWRGLGGALLSHLGETGTGYSQTRVNDPASLDDPAAIAALPPELQARHAAELAAAQAAALAGVADQASTADFHLKLASGRTVQLRLVDSGGFGPIGMQASITASGPLSAEERTAVQALADGLDRALAGLGQPDAARLDLSGLLGADRSVIAGLDLTVVNAQHGGALERFELHVGGDKPSVLLKGVEGEMRLAVDATTARAGAPAAQRAQALRELTTRVASAGERGQANAALVAQMSSALVQLQTAVAAAGPTTPAPAAAPASAARGGLADFEAGFSGNTWRLNGAGTARQAGQVDYQLSQRTEPGDARSGLVRQTLSEALSADFRASPDGGMLDVSRGHYTATRVRDRSTVTTLMESLPNGQVRERQQTDADQNRTVTAYVAGKLVRQTSQPQPQHGVVRRG